MRGGAHGATTCPLPTTVTPPADTARPRARSWSVSTHELRRRPAVRDVRATEPGLQPLGSLVPAEHINSVCEAREGAGPYQPPGNRNRGGKAEKLGSQEAAGRPPRPDPDNAGEGRSPRRPFCDVPRHKLSRRGTSSGSPPDGRSRRSLGPSGVRHSTSPGEKPSCRVKARTVQTCRDRGQAPQPAAAPGPGLTDGGDWNG